MLVVRRTRTVIGAITHMAAALLLFVSILAQGAVLGHAREYVPIWPVLLYVGVTIAIFQFSNLNAFAGSAVRIRCYLVIAALWTVTTGVAEVVIQLGYAEPSESLAFVRVLMHLGWLFACFAVVIYVGGRSNKAVQPTRRTRRHSTS